MKKVMPPRPEVPEKHEPPAAIERPPIAYTPLPSVLPVAAFRAAMQAHEAIRRRVLNRQHRS